MPKSGQTWDPDFLLGDPLFQPFEGIAAPLRGPAFPKIEALTTAAERERLARAPEVHPLEFVAALKKPRRQKRGAIVLDELYDGRIALRGEVPCLAESYHDLFNAIAFAAFPRSKRALHARQFSALGRWVDVDASRIPGQRTREQDALTIFDEGGVILAMTEQAHRAWRATSEESLYTPGCGANSDGKSRSGGNFPSLGEGRSGGGICALLFGHALVEHLYEDHLAIRASAMVCVVSDECVLGASNPEYRTAAERLPSERLPSERLPSERLPSERLPTDRTLAGSPYDALLDEVDRQMGARLMDPTQFTAPGADCIFEMRRDGKYYFGPPKIPANEQPAPERDLA